MAKPTSKPLHWLGRLVKALVGVLLIPPVLGLTLGLSRQLDVISAGARPCAWWFVWGVAGYVGLHLLFYKPKILFRLNHALLARLAVWLFGGQVATVDADGVKGSKSQGKTKEKSASGGGSTLVVLSPYLVPLYVVLVSVVMWLVARVVEAGRLNGMASFLIGASLAFHVAMTAEDLQQDKNQFPFETHLMALAISSLSSLLVASACLALAIAGFSVPGVLAEAAATAQAIYTSVFQTLFF